MLLSLMLVAGLTSGLQAPTDEGVITLAACAAWTRRCERRLTKAAAGRRSLPSSCETSNGPIISSTSKQVPALRNGMKGALLHGTGGKQYLRIHLKRDLPLDRQVAVLAHELQHVREVVQAGISAHAAEMEMLFRRIGGSDWPAAGGNSSKPLRLCAWAIRSPPTSDRSMEPGRALALAEP